jgi:hypothetical protein
MVYGLWLTARSRRAALRSPVISAMALRKETILITIQHFQKIVVSECLYRKYNLENRIRPRMLLSGIKAPGDDNINNGYAE